MDESKVDSPPRDSARQSPVPFDSFHRLVEDINKILGPSNGIDSADVDVEELQKLMGSYESNEEDWQPYAFVDYSRAYTRNLVDRGNGKSNLVYTMSRRSSQEVFSNTMTAHPRLDTWESFSHT